MKNVFAAALLFLIACGGEAPPGFDPGDSDDAAAAALPDLRIFMGTSIVGDSYVYTEYAGSPVALHVHPLVSGPVLVASKAPIASIALSLSGGIADYRGKSEIALSSTWSFGPLGSPNSSPFFYGMRTQPLTDTTNTLKQSGTVTLRPAAIMFTDDHAPGDAYYVSRTTGFWHAEGLPEELRAVHLEYYWTMIWLNREDHIYGPDGKTIVTPARPVPQLTVSNVTVGY